MVIHELGHFIIAKKFGVKVEEFGIGYPPRILGKQYGDTLYSINVIPLGAFVKIYGEEGGIDDYRSFSKMPILKRILIVLGGVIAFWVAAAIIFSIVSMVGVQIPIGDQDIEGLSNSRIVIMQVQENSPASTAGLKKGDSIISLNNGDQTLFIKKITDFQEFAKENKGRQIVIVAERDGKETPFLLSPRITYPEGQGPTGVSLERMATVIQKYPWYKAPLQGVIVTFQITWQALGGIYRFFADLSMGRGVPSGSELAGPVGITIFLARAADYGPPFFLYFIGSITVLIALFNAFPIPALDGGKLVFLIIEGITKKPVPARIEQSITILCFMALIVMSLFVTFAFDIPRVVEFWKASL